MPTFALRAWNAFAEISRTRQTGAMGICRITRLEVRLWEEDEGVCLQPWERRAIFRLDDEYIAIMTPKDPGKKKDTEGSHFIP